MALPHGSANGIDEVATSSTGADMPVFEGLHGAPGTLNSRGARETSTA
jgi:hypothetical protein